ncbi:MAG: hypothetical protein ABJA67_12765 [Chthonomonadales bacterium]
MSQYDRERQGREFEGYAFTFCKAAFLVLIFRDYSLLALSGLATVFYVAAYAKGVREWRCWVKHPWVTIFWACVFVFEVYRLFFRHT